MKLKELLKKELTEKELDFVPSSFDQVGDILIFNFFPEELRKKEKTIGKRILETFKNIKVIAKKTGKYSGEYRIPKIRIIAGEKRKETIHKENSIQLKLHVEKVYFSARTATERKRIFQQVQPWEDVLVMFSGIAPLPLVISKNTKAKEIYGIEINPTAHKYALESIKLNKAKNIRLFLGDVRKILPKIKKEFDRILMPLPKSSEQFLDLALSKIKKNGIIHLYSFGSLEQIDEKSQKIHEICKQSKKHCKILNIVKCGQFSPSEFRLCFDISVF